MEKRVTRRIDLDESSAVQDNLLLLSEAEAVNEYLDEDNIRRTAQMLWFFAATFAIYSLVSFLQKEFVLGPVAAAGVAANVVVLRLRHRELVARNVRQVASAVLIAELLLLQVFHYPGVGALSFWFILLPLIAVRFRFATGEHLALFGALFAVLTARLIAQSLLNQNEQPPFQTLLLYFVILYLPAFGLAWGLTQWRERRFLSRWRSEAGRHRERLRMKRELEYARQIQLSMLPRQSPDLGWLDVAALSLPATEVGGDYYDYFALDGDRLAVVVGDVTGHGVASGLVLSGVRASLNLLHEELDSPRRILGRVNAMLKRTSTPRMLMTLGLAVLDRQQKRVRVATAGHPPVLLLRSGSTEVDEVGSGSFPLGAVADTEYEEDMVDLKPGDVLLLYSDGLVEAANDRDEQFGWDRLKETMVEQAESTSAREIRDAILRDVWEFKGDTEQADDVTMVVIRIRSETAANTDTHAG